MIPCSACNHENPLSARFCRSCGAKLKIRQSAVLRVMASTQADDRAQRWMAQGHSLVAIGGFVLVCALLLRYVVVPVFPRADIPALPTGDLVPERLPAAAPAAH